MVAKVLVGFIYFAKVQGCDNNSKVNDQTCEVKVLARLLSNDKHRGKV